MRPLCRLIVFLALTLVKVVLGAHTVVGTVARGLWTLSLGGLDASGVVLIVVEVIEVVEH